MFCSFLVVVCVYGVDCFVNVVCGFVFGKFLVVCLRVVLTLVCGLLRVFSILSGSVGWVMDKDVCEVVVVDSSFMICPICASTSPVSVHFRCSI